MKTKIIALLVSVLICTGCASQLDEMIQAVQLEEGEVGSVCLRATIDTNPNPFAMALVTFVYREKSSEQVPNPDC